MSLLVMTLLVRDETDIIRDNIEFHLNHGVDFIIATDNNSTDGTREVLAEYEALGVVHLIDEPGRDYAQAHWVTRMALLARETFGAEWILNNDADEFWWPQHGDLKHSLDAATANMIRCKRKNMLFPHDRPQPTSWHGDIIYHVATPLPKPPLDDLLTDPLPCPYYYLDLPSKVLCRARGLQAVRQGNHEAVYAVPTKEPSQNITIYHYPIRSFDHFVQKVSLGGQAYAANKTLPIDIGWHWRRWYKKLQEQDVESAFKETLPSAERLLWDLDAHRIEVDLTLRTTFKTGFKRFLSDSSDQDLSHPGDPLQGE